MHLGLFYAETFGNYVPCVFTFMIFVLFLKVLFHFNNISKSSVILIACKPIEGYFIP